LLAKLAWDFSPEQLDHLFECFQVFYRIYDLKNCNILYKQIYFQASWTTAGKKQREKLLELIRRLAEDDNKTV
jgi:ubiquitin carboxyl-terminal hydrolase 9/24